MSKNKVEENLWRLMKQRLGYNDEEFEKFRDNPRNAKILERAEDLMKKTVIFEVTESHNCNIEHKTGDRFLFSAEGYMLAHKGPKKICPYLMPAMARLMWVVQERLYEGLDPEPTFPVGHCEDVGINCGGWGRVAIKTIVVDR